jgi:hypothetical protein
VRTFADPAFFRLFYTLLSEGQGSARHAPWSYRGASWAHERHAFSGSVCSFAIDRYIVARSGLNGWALLVVKETWWDGKDNAIRSIQWAKPLSGSRAKTLEWLRGEERRIAAARPARDKEVE